MNKFLDNILVQLSLSEAQFLGCLLLTKWKLWLAAPWRCQGCLGDINKDWVPVKEQLNCVLAVEAPEPPYKGESCRFSLDGCNCRPQHLCWWREMETLQEGSLLQSQHPTSLRALNNWVRSALFLASTLKGSTAVLLKHDVEALLEYPAHSPSVWSCFGHRVGLPPSRRDVLPLGFLTNSCLSHFLLLSKIPLYLAPRMSSEPWALIKFSKWSSCVGPSFLFFFWIAYLLHLNSFFMEKLNM